MRNATMINPASVFKDSKVFASFAVKDLDAAREFYGRTLGLDVRDTPGAIEIRGQASQPVWVYPKQDHQPAVFTVLNLQVRNIEDAVDALTGAGVKFEHYNGEFGIKTDAKGIARDDKGPNMAWFRDPSRNIVAVMEGSVS
jgi:catechol 2,3-dioxygenase-like lactoylglutathione lyase family enzyme